MGPSVITDRICDRTGLRLLIAGENTGGGSRVGGQFTDIPVLSIMGLDQCFTHNARRESSPSCKEGALVQVW